MGTQHQQLLMPVGSGNTKPAATLAMVVWNTTPAATDVYRKWGHNTWRFYFL